MFFANVTQLAERQPSKLEVMGSNPIIRFYDYLYYGGELDSTGCRDRFVQGCMSKHYKGLKQITANDNVAISLAA